MRHYIKLAFFFLFFFFSTNCNQDTIKIVVDTPTIQCGMCQKSIETGLGKLKGIAFSKVDLETKTATIHYNGEKINIETIENAISDLGYQANKTLADSIAYKTLPDCCKIGGMN